MLTYRLMLVAMKALGPKRIKTVVKQVKKLNPVEMAVTVAMTTISQQDHPSSISLQLLLVVYLLKAAVMSRDRPKN